MILQILQAEVSTLNKKSKDINKCILYVNVILIIFLEFFCPFIYIKNLVVTLVFSNFLKFGGHVTLTFFILCNAIFTYPIYHDLCHGV